MQLTVKISTGIKKKKYTCKLTMVKRYSGIKKERGKKKNKAKKIPRNKQEKMYIWKTMQLKKSSVRHSVLKC